MTFRREDGMHRQTRLQGYWSLEACPYAYP